MDLATIGGLILALGAIFGGQALEGGTIESIMQPTAGIIVIGGTLGAVCVQFPGAVLKQALSDLVKVFKPDKPDFAGAIKTLVSLADKARRDGLVSIEKDVLALRDPFMKRGLELAVDGTDARIVRSAMEMELTHVEEEIEAPPKVLEAAGGYSPTVGIIGAVLGLIHVMENLSDPSKLGSGIAVAFVATVYGVGTANLFFLPMAAKMKIRAHERIALMGMIIEGVCALVEGENPRLISRKLSIFAHDKGHNEAGAKAPERA